MGRPQCKVCKRVAGAAEGSITMTRSGFTRTYQFTMCIMCWVALSHVLEDQSDGWNDMLPFEMTAESRRAVKRHRSSNGARN